MAQIDLKHATIYLEDGYDGPSVVGLVNNMSGYTAPVTVIAVDGFTGNVEVGDRFTIAGDTDENGDLVVHVVTAHAETTMNTTGITFTGTPTQEDIADDAVITVLPHQVEVEVGEGNLTYTEAKTWEYKLNRGILSSGKVRAGDDVPVDVKLDFIWEFLRSASGETPSIEDILKNRGEAADWVSSGADSCEGYCIDIRVEYVPECEDVDKEVIILPEFRYESLEHNLKDGTVAVSGKCKATEATVTRG